MIGAVGGGRLSGHLPYKARDEPDELGVRAVNL